MSLPNLIRIRTWAQLKIIDYWEKEMKDHIRYIHGCDTCRYSNSISTLCIKGTYLHKHITEERAKL